MIFRVRSLAVMLLAFGFINCGEESVMAADGGWREAWEVRGFSSLGGGQSTYPRDTQIYTARDDRFWQADLRLLLDGDLGRTHITANILESARSKPPLSPLFAALLPKDVKRTSTLTWEQHDTFNSRAELVADTLLLQYRSKRLDLTLGRQPVNLATTFYFVPNDFFAPFDPQTFFRTYKPGVDALRVDLLSSRLSQLTVLGVLDYDPDPDSSNGWSREPNWSSTSILARFGWEGWDIGWTLLVGTVNDHTVSGGAIQGDILDLIGIRAEGHYADPETSDGSSYYSLSAGVEQNFANNSSWRLEYFQNGNRQLAQQFLTGRDYLALGLGYEFSPLLNGGMAILGNLSDDSRLYTVNLLYSLSDEAELSLTASLPDGDRPGTADPGSEYGLQPRSAMLEYRQNY